MREKTLILFDIGAVLVRLDYAGFYQAAAQHSPFDVSTVEKRYRESSLDDLAIEGKITAQEFFQRLRAVLSFPASLSHGELRRIIEKMCPEQIPAMVALKKQLSQAGYAVGLFSNIGEAAHLLLSSKYPEIFAVYHPQNPVVLSYTLHTMKPAPKMYEIIKGFDKVTLIDDKDQYLKTGIERFGWHGIHFTQYIDTTEPQRLDYADIGIRSSRLRKADSFPKVKEALTAFGVVF